jgi:hypothetical protein
VCGDDADPNPDINKDDVSKDKDNALPKGITPSDGQEALEGHVGRDLRFTEQFGTRTFEQVWPDVSGIKRNVAPPEVDEAWRNIGEQLHTSILNFERSLRGLRDSGDWEGKTIEAAFTNALESTAEPFHTGTAALRGAELTHKFRDTMNYVFDHLVKDPLGEFPSMWERYQFDLNNQETPIEGAPGQQSYYYEATTAAEKEAIKQYYNEYMRIVMNDSYLPGIKDIYGAYPKFIKNPAPAQPVQIPGLPEKPGRPTHESGGDRSTGGGGGTPSFGGGGLPGGGGGIPSIPKTPGPSLPAGLKEQLQDQLKDRTKLPSPGDTDIPGQTDRPSLTDPSQAMANGLPGGLANAANQALGSATKAAKAAPPGGLPTNVGKKPTLPEGALRLGKGGPGSGAGGGSGAGAGGAGVGGGASRLPGLPAAATHAETAGTARPAMGTNAPMMGPPGTPGGAGHGGGGAQQAKDHKVSKALRRRQNGTEIAGEAEAVVPVIGADQGEDQQQDAAAAQRGTDRPREPSVTPPPAPVPATRSERRQLGGGG